MNLAGNDQALRNEVKDTFVQKCKELGFAQTKIFSRDDYKNIWDLMMPKYPWYEEIKPEEIKVEQAILSPIDPPRFARRDYRNYVRFLEANMPVRDQYTSADLSVIWSFFPQVDQDLQTHIWEMVSAREPLVSIRGSV